MARRYLEKIRELIDFLTLSEVSPNELGRHLTLNTFNFLNPKSVYFASLDNEGFLTAVDCFGVSEDLLAPFTKLNLKQNFPHCVSVRTGKILIAANQAEWSEKYPEFNDVPKTFGWQAMVTIPINVNRTPIGAMSITFVDSLETNQDFLNFIEAISSLVALQLIRAPHGRLGSISLNSSNSQFENELTKREIEILKLIADGLTNTQIARKMGYSESTIRHETMKIYELFNVSGRKEAVSFAISRKIIERATLLLPLLVFNLFDQFELAIPQLSLIGI